MRKKIKYVPFNTFRFVGQTTAEGGVVKGIQCLWCTRVTYEKPCVDGLYCPHCNHWFKKPDQAKG